MSEVKIILTKDGKMHIDVDMPDGPDCDKTAEEIKLAMQLLGLDIESSTDVTPPKQPEATVQATKLRQGSK